MKYVCILVYYG